jgi:ethanolamine transporter EutH
MDETDNLQYLPFRIIEVLCGLLVINGISMWFTAPHVTMVPIETAQKIALMVIGFGGVMVVATEIGVWWIKRELKKIHEEYTENANLS